jgi:endonuclease/exonuclease/phosphatase family metal-dependent hydrolase
MYMKRYTVCGTAVPALFLAFLFAAVVCGCDFSGESMKAGTEKRESAKEHSVIIMTWNVQALFDGTETGNEYDEYREAAGWSREKYAGRLNVIAKAVEGIEPEPPDIIAIQEIESGQVLEDLAAALSKYGYAWTHFAGNPEMSLGLGILSRLPLDAAKIHSISADGDTAPRPVLEARVSAGNESLALFVCHWKSKLGGEDATEANRRASARIILRRMRELAEEDPDLPVIIMGDLNENHDEFYRRNGAAISALLPDDLRAAELAGLYEADGNDQNVLTGELWKDFLVLSKDKPPAARHFPSQVTALYSPWFQELSNGSYYYRNEWETIDHFLLSKQLFNGVGWEFDNSAAAAYQPFTATGGYPAAYNPRTGSGLSDHLPLLLFLKCRER